MAETMQSLDQLSSLKPATPETPKYVQKLDSQGRAYATGKRKDAVARVWVKPGSGTITVNERAVEAYFARPVLRMLIKQPLVTANRQGQYDVVCTVSGGGHELDDASAYSFCHRVGIRTSRGACAAFNVRTAGKSSTKRALGIFSVPSHLRS